MKKLLLIVIAVCFALPVFAQLEQGQHMVGGRLGLGFQLQNTGISYGTVGSRVDWGTLGSEYGLTYYYLVEKHIGVGADISMGHFDGGDLTSLGSSAKVSDDTNLFNAMLSARFTLNPDHRFRVYMPVGVGLTSSRQKLDVSYHGLVYDKKATDNSLGWFVGAGMESDIGHNGWSWGFETRINGFSYDYHKLTDGAPSQISGQGKRNLSYMSFQLRVNKRF